MVISLVADWEMLRISSEYWFMPHSKMLSIVRSVFSSNSLQLITDRMKDQIGEEAARLKSTR